MSKKSKNKSNYKPKNYSAIPHAILDDPDFLSLNWSSQCLLIHMTRFYNGFNNGDLSIPISIMKKRGWTRGTLERSKKDLLNNNWILVTRQGFKKTCSLYALTWIPIDDCKGKLDIKGGGLKLRRLLKG
jgi:hypothetical protein